MYRTRSGFPRIGGERSRAGCEGSAPRRVGCALGGADLTGRLTLPDVARIAPLRAEWHTPHGMRGAGREKAESRRMPRRGREG